MKRSCWEQLADGREDENIALFRSRALPTPERNGLRGDVLAALAGFLIGFLALVVVWVLVSRGG